MQKDPVGQTGQRVVQSLVADLTLSAIPFDRGSQHVGDRLDEVRLVGGEGPRVRPVRHQHGVPTASRADTGGDPEGSRPVPDDRGAIRRQRGRDDRGDRVRPVRLLHRLQHRALGQVQGDADQLDSLREQVWDGHPAQGTLTELSDGRLQPFRPPQIRDILQHECDQFLAPFHVRDDRDP